MIGEAPRGRYEFGPFTLTTDPLALARDGESVALRLQGLKLLRLLVENAGELVTHDAIRRALWGERHVDHTRGIHLIVREVRCALADEAERPLYIETLPRQGYRFLSDVRRLEGATAARPSYRWLAAAAAAFTMVAGGALLVPRPTEIATQPSYEKAAHLLATGGDIEAAKTWLREALASDPANPDTLAAMAWAARLEGDFDIAGQHAQAALSASPRHPRALLERGLVAAQRDWDFGAAAADISAAIDAAPSFADAHIAEAVIHTIRRRNDSAIAASERAYEADPVSALVRIDHGWFHYYAGEYAAARDICAEAELLGADPVPAVRCQFKAARLAGDDASALDAANKIVSQWRAESPGEPALPATVSSLDAFDALRRARMERLAPVFAAAPEQLALAHAGLGEHAAALDQLEAALAQRRPNLPFILRDPVFAALEDDPRFQAVVAKVTSESASAALLR